MRNEAMIKKNEMLNDLSMTINDNLRGFEMVWAYSGINQQHIHQGAPAEDLRGFEGDTSANPGIGALYVEGFSEAAAPRG